MQKAPVLGLLLLLLCIVPFVHSQQYLYYGNEDYSSTDCSTSFNGYGFHPVGKCFYDSKYGAYQDGSCNSTHVTLKENCTADCSTCYDIHYYAMNACVITGSGSKKWMCFTTTPIPSSSYYDYRSFDTPYCTSNGFYESAVFLTNNCLGTSKINCVAQNQYAVIYTCANGTNCGTCSNVTIPAGLCSTNGNTSSYLACNSVTGPSVSPTPSTSTTPSITPSTSATPSVTPTHSPSASVTPSISSSPEASDSSAESLQRKWAYLVVCGTLLMILV